LLCLLLCSACSGKHVVTIPSVERLVPPASLLSATERPAWNGTTNGDLLRHTFALDTALAVCNADKAAIRSWVVGLENATEETNMGKGQ